MSDNSQATNDKPPLKRIQEQIERLADRPSGLVDLGYALAGTLIHAHEQACDICQAALPEYIEAELNGQPVRRLFPAVARHLESCPNCGEAYVDLMEIALQAEVEPLPVPPPAPVLDLAFLPSLSPAVRIRQLVETFVEQLVRQLNPEALEDLSTLTREFFRKVGEAETTLRLQPASTLALRFGTDLSPALRSLVAAYHATETILHTLSAEELADELGGPQRPRTVERQARSSVQAAGMGRGEAKEWAGQYVILAQAHAAEFLVLARQVAEDELSE